MTQPFHDSERAGEGREGWIHTMHGTESMHAFLGWGSEGSFLFRSTGGEISVSKNELIAFGGEVAPLRFGMLCLTDESCIAGHPISLTNRTIQWGTKRWGMLEFPLSWVRGCIMHPNGVHSDWNETKRFLFESQGSRDAIQIERTGWLEGTFELDSDGIRFLEDQSSRVEIPFRINGQKKKIEWSRIQAILFSPEFGPLLKKSPELGWLFFQDGDRLHLDRLQKDQQSLKIRLGVPTDLTSQGKVDHCSKEVSGFFGKAPVRWLSQEEPASYRIHPRGSLRFPLQRERTREHGPIVWDELSRWRSLVMVSHSQCAYRLESNAQRFAAEIASPPEPLGERIFSSGSLARVWVSRGGPLEEIYTSPILRSGEKSVAFSLDVKGAKLLVLTVESVEPDLPSEEVYWFFPRVLASP